MKWIRLFQIIPEGTLKNRLRCAFYTARMKPHGVHIEYRAGRFRVRYQGVEAVFLQNPYYKGAGQVMSYFQRHTISPGDIVIDAGACEGDFALIASKLVGENGKVVAFEPDPANAAALQANIEANRAGNIVVVQKGLWREDTTLRFKGNEGQYSALCLDGPPADANGTIEVVALDNELARLGIDRVDFVKVDIEGAEIEFIEGARGILDTSDAKLAIASYHIVHGKPTAPEVERQLRDLGYDVESAFPEHLTTYAWKKRSS